MQLGRSGQRAILWGRNHEHVAEMQNDRCNARFLPDYPFPDEVELISQKSADGVSYDHPITYRVQLDAITSNELRDPDDLVTTSQLSDWRDLPR